MQKCALFVSEHVLIGSDDEDTCRYIRIETAEQEHALFVEPKKDWASWTHPNQFEIDQCFDQEVYCAQIDTDILIAIWEDDELTYLEDPCYYQEYLKRWTQEIAALGHPRR